MEDKVGPSDNVQQLLGLAIGTADAIPAAERAGQASMVNEEVLPIDGMKEICGIKIVKPFHDDLFHKVSLPEGWSKRATDHSMHSDLLDANGCKRGSIFYKAAFYDRSASMHFCRRYSFYMKFVMRTETRTRREKIKPEDQGWRSLPKSHGYEWDDDEFEMFESTDGRMIQHRMRPKKPPEPQYREVEYEEEVVDHIISQVVDNGSLDEDGNPTVIFTAGTEKDPGHDVSREERLAHIDRKRGDERQCEQWLDENYPRHLEAEAYWYDEDAGS